MSAAIDNVRGNGSLRYLFEDFAFDTDRRELRRGADIIAIAPKVFDLLDYLIRNRDRVVSKDDLIDAVWDGRIVSDGALTTRLNVARNAVGDTGDQQRLIKTLPRKGFRFIGPVKQAQESNAEVTDHQADLPQHSIAQPDRYSAAGDGSATAEWSEAPRLSIVVLPFANLGDQSEQDYFVDGITENLTTDLSRISGAFVIARNTAFTFKGKAVDVRRLGRELNVRYVLEGSLQRGDNRLRVNVQLIDAETGNHLWAERFETPVTNHFDMQDEIVSRLANTLNAELIDVEARRAEYSPHPDAMELVFQGKSCWNKGMTSEYMAQAMSFFERALVLDPANIEALVGTAAVDAACATVILSGDRLARCVTAEAALINALSISPRHARAHMFLGAVQITTRRGVQGIRQCEQALALDRNLAEAHAIIGIGKLLIGRGEETEAHIKDALRISPRDTGAFRWMHHVGITKLFLGIDTEAIVWLRRCLEANRNHPIAHLHLAAALVLVGSVEEGRAAVRAGLALDPTFTMRRLRGRLSDDPAFQAANARIREAMLTAGAPEE